MNLKDIFDKAENGTLTYEQFMAAATGTKFVDLTEGQYVAKQKYTDDLAARDTRITTLSDTLTQRDADLAELQNKLTAAGTDSERLGQLSADFTDLQKRYDTDTKAYQRQLKEQEYRFAVTEFVSGLEFSSQAAKRDFINELLSKKLAVDNGNIVGATDVLNSYKANNADAFVSEIIPQIPEPKPQFVSATTPNSGDNNTESTPFHFSFTGVRPHDNK